MQTFIPEVESFESGACHLLFRSDVHYKIAKIILKQLKGELLSEKRIALPTKIGKILYNPPGFLLETHSTVYTYRVDNQNIVVTNIARVQSCVSSSNQELLIKLRILFVSLDRLEKGTSRCNVM